jgi:hypothetical protein
MALTPKQEKFCQCIADGMTQADSYRASYNASRMSKGSVYVRASELMSDSKREDSVNALKKIAEGDRGSEVVAAVKELNSMHGYNEPKKMELTGKDGGPMEIKTLDSFYEES